MNKGTIASWTIGWIWSIIFLIAVVSAIAGIIALNTPTNIELGETRMDIIAARAIHELTYVDPYTLRAQTGVLDGDKLGNEETDTMMDEAMAYPRPNTVGVKVTVEDKIRWYHKDDFRHMIEQINIKGGPSYKKITMPVVIHEDPGDRASQVTIEVVMQQ